MRDWFRGKRGGLVVFLVIAALVVGGLGWATREALRLEEEQNEARGQAQRASDLRVALWRLDTRISTDLLTEANRPYHHYYASEPIRCAPNPPAAGDPPFTLMEMIPWTEDRPPRWMTRHFLVAPGPDWRTPPLLKQTLVQALDLAGQVPPEVNRDQQQRTQPLEVVCSHFDIPRLFAEARQRDGSWQYSSPPLSLPEPPNPGSSGQAGQQPPEPQQAYPQQVPGPYQANEPVNNKTMSRDTALRQERAQKGQLLHNQGFNTKDLTEPRGPDPHKKQVLAILGPVVPLWLSDGAAERLVVTRMIQLGEKQVCQVTLLDWDELRAVLAEEVRDLFPQAAFVPVRDGAVAHPDRTMTALPIELDPGPAVVAPELGWTPLRIGLALAWAAALVALTAVGWGGWSILDLSERRMRFVSAVTHELRTPLTTLRLYLDMLTGGMVQDDRRKAEYLHTLNAEADRLSRLITNVLDFSRLERQRPRLARTEIAVAELLGQLRAAWEERCRDAGKLLVLDNGVEHDARVFTDAGLVQQVLGNLIDNACKYSRGADDPRVWLRVRRDHDRLVFEVQDCGPGVPDAERRLIFRPFRRGHSADVTAGGVGLGLALAQRWAQLLGGQLSLRTGSATPGACFRLELPLA
jgi:signal transduction histidine kinase